MLGLGQYLKGDGMITVDEIKEALLKISDTEIINNSVDEDEKSLKFRKNGELFTIYSLPKNELSETNLRLSRFIKLPKNTMSKEEGEYIEAAMNLTNNTPCKTVYIYKIKDIDLDNGFFITNIYTDKLDYFEKTTNEKIRTSNIIILILGMIVEVMLCNQDITTKANELAEKRLKEGAADGK